MTTEKHTTRRKNTARLLRFYRNQVHEKQVLLGVLLVNTHCEHGGNGIYVSVREHYDTRAIANRCDQLDRISAHYFNHFTRRMAV